MINSQSTNQLDSSIKEVLKKTSSPPSPESWEEMERLLEKDHSKYGSTFGDYSQYIIVGVLGVALIGGLVFMLFRNQPIEQYQIGVKTETVTAIDTNLLMPTVLQDSIKTQQTVTVTTSSIDSLALKNEEQTKAQNKTDEPKKKKIVRDSTNVSSTNQNSETDSTGVKKPKKKKKKKSGTSKDSLLKTSEPLLENAPDNTSKLLQADEPIKSNVETPR